ncbi:MULTISPECIES: VOC family protein [unclassified Paenibacillus]|uniref:VOC family protein n=1 Tax=unclassified Paenibacillus TaxID=185978 RepID=UPI0024054E4B|nr:MULTISPECIES: VOC family protein [unclassified Paenibacillus]MDF9840552.1 lactoylglutathione lyase [Paenibacillus sp. PastF-2]MDF9847134.1 lactoylglutathione lyase [Paenibacillus sp. PastM-2]MDF9853706.1 lactoylglutathione lyase [Paenibacillus sp. PastF-1]MDH6478808.1 lactoylglutathione lyase [Paenibacillus sp. PastH-2]MDH6506540.1 lactoylglutathione lyase [Paenibacillus sp. PastM-3]
MIKQIGQVMLYVNDQDQALRFWTEKLGFIKVSEANNGQGLRWIEISPAEGAQTSFVLHNKQHIAQMQPELHLGTPSIMLHTDDLDGRYQDFQNKDITVGDLVDMPGGRVFNFADDENNYFAVTEAN